VQVEDPLPLWLPPLTDGDTMTIRILVLKCRKSLRLQKSLTLACYLLKSFPPAMPEHAKSISRRRSASYGGNIL
jgi:hypothetical protein